MNINCAVTIDSGNYLAYARVLGESLRATNVAFDFRVLIVDRKTPLLEQLVRELDLDVTFAEDLPLPDLERIFYKYDIVELNTALKPTFVKQTFGIGYKHVLYLDPDIRVFAPLVPVLDALNNADIVLTPHALGPVMDAMRPSDVDFLRTGVYNLGFIGLKASKQTNAMLDWWESRCLGMGFNDPAFGIFVDQKWIDLVPSYFSSVYILRHPGCNVAYWNLHEREVLRDLNGFAVNSLPLVYFHFSGIVPSNSKILSKHQNRHNLEFGSALSELVQDYCAELIRLEHNKFSKIPYGFAVLDDGSPITPTMRRALLVVPYEERQPFNCTSRFQRELRAAGISVRVRSQSSAKALNTMTFDQSDSKVLLVNLMIRFIRKMIGLPRLLSILRYASLLVRETHLPAVLLKRPLDLEHKMRR
jgi:hypothetical protein